MKKLFFLIFIPLYSFSNPDFEKGKRFFLSSEFDSALVCFSNLISGGEGKCHDTTLALYKTYLGKTYNMLEQYEKALNEFEQAISLMDGAGNYNGKSFAMISLAEMYRKSFKLDKAKKELEEVFELNAAHPLTKNNESYLYNRFAAVLNELEEESGDVSIYSNKVLELVKQTGDLDMKSSSLNELGYFEEKRKRYDAATGYYLEAYEIQRTLNNPIYIAQMLTNLARVSNYNGKHSECEAYLLKGIDLTENTQWYDTRAALYGFYSTFLYKQARYRESRDELGKFVDMEVAKLRKQQSRAMIEMESKYELTKKDAQVELQKQKAILAGSDAAKKTLQRNYIFAGVLFLLIVLGLLFLSYKKIRKANVSLSAALSDRDVLLKEVNHRVKNNLQVISSLLELQYDYTVDDISRVKLLECKNRINTIAQVHELMYSQDNLVNLNMNEYITILSNEVKNNLWKEVEGNVILSCDNIELRITEAIPVGILINELLTNSFKHARPSEELLKINIELNRNSNKIVLKYSDNGKNSTVEPEKSGIGTTVINSMVRQLHGQSELSANGNFNFQMTFEQQA